MEHDATTDFLLSGARAAQPLYLAPDDETWVGLDGPALRVARRSSAPLLFPLQRIGRIHSNLRVDWEMAALLACAEHGIPVVFIDDDGAVQARLLGRPGGRDELSARLLEFLLRPEASGMLQHWCGQHRARAARWAALKLGLSARARLRARDVRERINRNAEEYGGVRAALRTRQWLRALAYGWMESHLRDLGFGRATELAQAGQPALASELTEILFWYLEPARLGWLKRRHLAARHKGEVLREPTQREVVRLFEGRSARAATRGREITSALHRWLIHET
ncbi:CRISPR-associated endonuclease Cas1 [Marichromatium gracile]|uniref:CRISPR-associated endonuclease Cas1 n=1 Tax=Marichromatium gracile TaxID=1048 RepID=UPI0013667659|nr:CRISPR-associated endonuclease Cas1 [Marichromatium gracile]